MAEFNLVITGPPGSGKGTQADSLARRFGVKHAVRGMGSLLRENLKNNSAFAAEVKPLMEAGHLVPSDKTNQLFIDYFEKCSGIEPFLFDGYPRSADQVENLAAYFAPKKIKFWVINLLVNPEMARLRCQSRLEHDIAEGLPGRDDDRNLDSFENRITVYDQNYGKVRHAVRKHKNVFPQIIDIDADKSVKEVTAEILQEIYPYLSEDLQKRIMSIVAAGHD